MKRIPRFASMPGLFAALALCLLCSAIPTLAAQKFDAQTGIDMQQAGLEKMPDGTYMAARGPMAAKTVRVLVRFSGAGTLDDIRALGGVVHTVLGDIASVEIANTALGRLEAIKAVSHIDTDRPMPTRLNVSVPATRANLLRTGSAPNLSGVTGKGVIVGVIDDGVDFRHKDFQNTDGTTRLLGFWNLSAASGTPPSGYSFGNECTVQTLNDTINGASSCVLDSSGGHGTHVAGIAAGNGLATGNAQAAYRFGGMAPEADILGAAPLIRTTDSVAWMKARAAALGKPLVINMSFGSYFGARDGTSNTQKAYDNAAGPGVILVGAAGNEGDAKIRATGTISSAQTQSVTLNWGASVTAAQQIEIWYPGTNQYAVKLSGPSGCAMPDFVAAGVTQTFTLACGTIAVSSTDVQSNNDDRQILITITPAASAAAVQGDWTYQLRGDTVASAGTAFSLVGGEDSGAWQFTSNTEAVTRAILTDASSATRVIAVAAYNTNSSWKTTGNIDNNPANYNFGPLTDVANFSSRGPRGNCSNLVKCPAIMKPEITAPGAMIMAAMATDDKKTKGEALEADGQHVALNGTSMATPHVTGAIALMLQKNPTLTPEQVKAILARTVQTNQYTTALPSYDPASPSMPAVTNDHWGYGILDAQAAYNATPAVGSTVPGAPTIGSATGAGTSALIAFGAPASDGGNPIYSYVATCSASGQTTRAASAAASPVTVLGLTADVAYSCSVAAVNYVGAGSASAASSVTASSASAPGAPTMLAATAGVGTASISFSAPASNGGSAITGYTATCTPLLGQARTASGTSSPLEVSLTNGLAYSCTVTASNAVGTSAPSAAVSAASTGVVALPPGAPIIGGVVAGVGSASISFSAPVYAGTSPITSYAATCSASGQTSQSASGAASPLTVSGLTGLVQYSCSVTATNSVGTGAASSAATVTPTQVVSLPQCTLTASASTVSSSTTVLLTANCTPVASSYLWTNTGFTGASGSGSLKPFYTTSYSVQGVDANGTAGSAASVTVTVNDTMALAAAYSAYALVSTSTGYTLTEIATGISQALSGVKRLKFSDASIALDIDGVAGQAYRLYQAAFNRAPDLGGLGYQMAAMEVNGLSLTQVAQNFINSPEFTTTYGATSDQQFVTLLYANVLKRVPDAGGMQFYLDGFADKTFTRAKVLQGFSESAENKTLVLPTVKNGIKYVPDQGN